MKFRIAKWLCLSGALLCAHAFADEPMTRQQGDAILNELREIKQLLAKQAVAPAPTPTPTAPRTLTITGAATHVLGKANAPVTLIAFTDFQCPYCARFESSTFPELKRKYIDTGKLRYVIRDVPLDFHPLALNAAQSVRCAGDQQHYWEMKDVVFKNQGKIDVDSLASYAHGLGLNDEQYRSCMATGKYAAAINTDRAYAQSLGISGTPSFVVGREVKGQVHGRLIVGAQSASVFEDAIEQALAKP